LVAWIPSVTVVLSHRDSRGLVVLVAVLVGGIAVVATIGFAGFLGYRRAWDYLAWSSLVGIATVGLVVFFVFAGSQPANAPDDPGLGLGAMLVTVAIVPPLALLLSLGGGIGRLIRSLRN
jgi:hypothetical protein